jgi:anti-sigma regulatory factor (Ser/Thr protein kinase)
VPAGHSRHGVDAEDVPDGSVPHHTCGRARGAVGPPSMTPRRLLPLAAVIVLLAALVAAVAVMTVAALPAALALGLAVLALVAGGVTRLRRWSGRRASTTVLTDVDHDAPVAEPGAPPLRWAVRWGSGPPAHLLPDTRERVAVVLAEWGLTGEAVEPTLLVVTELLSNAIEHARGPGRLSLELADDTVHVQVRDDAPEEPHLQSPDPLGTRGRGLQLVDALSSRWGWTDDSPGKVVWAEVPTRWPS